MPYILYGVSLAKHTDGYSVEPKGRFWLSYTDKFVEAEIEVDHDGVTSIIYENTLKVIPKSGHTQSVPDKEIIRRFFEGFQCLAPHKEIILD